MAKNPDFPTTLYVGREEDGDSSYFIADETMAGLAETEPRWIAVYKRVDTGVVRDLNIVKFKSDR